MNYGYIRVSTQHQSVDAQRYAIESYCNARSIKIDVWVEETISGTKDLSQRKLRKIIKSANHGDRIVCTEVSRLGRSMQIVGDIMKAVIEKKLCLYTIKENYTLEDNNPLSKLILQIYSYAAETERNLISERTREGLEAARRRGKTLGRPVGSKGKELKLDKYRDALVKGLVKGVKKTVLAKRFHVDTSTLYEYINKFNLYDDVEVLRAKMK